MVTDSRQQPLPYVSIRVPAQESGTLSKPDGSFELWLPAGNHLLEASMVSYKPLRMQVRLHTDSIISLVLADDTTQNLGAVVVKAKARDRAEAVIRELIERKDSLQALAGPYSVNLYIRASQQVTETQPNPVRKKGKQRVADPLKGFSLAEVALALDVQNPQRIKETRLGVQQSGDTRNLFYLSATEGNFDFYQNLVKLPGLAPTPFLSPVSRGGLLAYRYKTIKTVRRGKHRIYTIAVTPREFSNATVEGELTVSDSSWAILHTRFRLPAYHLQEFSAFEVEQDYDFVAQKAWMLTRQVFRYGTESNRLKVAGQTTVAYTHYRLQQQFGPRHFGSEMSTTQQQAYQQDSVFWKEIRVAPLTEKEDRLVRYTDSIRTVQQSEQYLDSVEKAINRITWQKIGIFGQSFYTRAKERYWHLPSLVSLYQPVAFGGSRINVSFAYRKTFANRTDLFWDNNLSYGIRNNDVNGFVKVRRLYNPFNRGYFEVGGGRTFQFIFDGDAWINMASRSNVYLNNYVQAAHGIELVNGLLVHTELETAFRRSVAGYKTGNLTDSLLGNMLNNSNQAVAFDPYNALYGKLRIQYTPFQRYRREPREKVIIGSKWPSFYVQWRTGIPRLLGSKVSFNHLEYGAEQQLNLGLLGLAKYSVKSGSFVNRSELRLIDYQFQRRGDPFLFLNPHRSFQGLDSTFPLFNRYLEAHYVHEFNGFFLNKVPLFKKLQLREMAGAGLLIAPERNLRYAELFVGVERAFQSPFNPLDKFKLGIYVVGSAANRFQNPIQIKIGFTTWDKRKNRWF